MRDYDNLGIGEKRRLLQMLIKEREQASRRPIDDYKPHEKQLSFHKSGAHIRLMSGGNRCLRGDQKILTEDGFKCIGEIDRGVRVLSIDHGSRSLVSSLASVPFVKGNENLYRVIHEGGEFVSSAGHRIFCLDNEYRPLSSLGIGERVYIFRDQTILDKFQSELVAGDLSYFGTGEDYLGDYQECIRLYDQRLPISLNIFRALFRLYTYGAGLFSSFFLEDFLRFGEFLVRGFERSRLYLSRSLLSNLDVLYREMGLSYGFFGGLVLPAASGRISQGSQSLQRFHEMLLNLKKDELFVQSTCDAYQNKTSYSNSLSITTILAIEKLSKKEEYYDLHVYGTNNYFTEDGINHHNSGKSTCGIAEDVWTSLGIHPYREVKVPNKGWICATDYPHGIATVIIPKIKSLLPKDCVEKIVPNSQGIPSIMRLKNGSVIEFKSYDQDSMKFESSDIDWCHLDEPPSEQIYNAVMRGLTDRNGWLWMTLTPLSEAWLFKKVWMPGLMGENKRVECFKMSIYDNTYLDKEGVEQFASTVSEQYKQARLYGEFQELQGRVFKTFNRSVHVINGFIPSPEWVVYMGVDPHVYGKKNQAALWCCITPDNDMVFFDEIWEDVTIEQLRDNIIRHDFATTESKNEVYERYNVVARVIDTSINIREALTHQNFKKLIESPGAYGKRLAFRMAQKKNLLNAGLEYINTLLHNTASVPAGTPRLLVDSRCKRLIEEFELHGWKENSSDNDVERELNTYNDMISIMRYILNLNPVMVRRDKAVLSNAARVGIGRPLGGGFGSYAGPVTGSMRFGGFYGGTRKTTW